MFCKKSFLVSLCLLLSLPLMTGCTGDETSGGEVDTAPPEVTASYPADGATGVSRSGPYWILFSEPMDEGSVEDAFDWSFPAGTGLHWEEDTMYVTLGGYLPASTAYTMTVGAESEDLHGNPLGSDFVIDFTTTAAEDNTPPTVVSTFPSDDAADAGPGYPVRITFTEPVSPVYGWPFPVEQTVVQIIPEPDDGYFETEGNDLVIFHTPFPTETVITITVTTDLTDLAGNPLSSAHTFDFTTAADDTRPYLASSSPTNGATGVSSMLASLYFQFSEPMFNGSFDMPPENIDMRMMMALAEEPEWSTDFSRIDLTLGTGLLPGCTYWVKFGDVTDMAANLIDPNPTEYQFTVSGTPSYYPVGDGYLWAYYEFEYTPTGSPETAPAVPQTMIRQIDNYIPASGEFDLLTIYSETTNDVQHLRTSPSGIDHLGRTEYDEGSPVSSMTWDDPLPYIKFPIVLGDYWSFSTTGSYDSLATGGWSYDLTIDGHCEIDNETIDYTREYERDGTIRDCYVHHLYVTIVAYDGQDPVAEMNVHQILWLGEGVGPVRDMSTEPGEPPTIYERDLYWWNFEGFALD